MIAKYVKHLSGGLYLSIKICRTIPASLGRGILSEVDDLFNVLWDSVYNYFIENFYIFIYQGNSSLNLIFY